MTLVVLLMLESSSKHKLILQFMESAEHKTVDKRIKNAHTRRACFTPDHGKKKDKQSCKRKKTKPDCSRSACAVRSMKNSKCSNSHQKKEMGKESETSSGIGTASKNHEKQEDRDSDILETEKIVKAMILGMVNSGTPEHSSSNSDESCNETTVADTRRNRKRQKRTSEREG